MNGVLCSPLFDELDFLEKNTPSNLFNLNDYEHAKSFLLSYKGSSATFNAYRREIEKLFQWSWHIAKKNICEIKRRDIEEYIEFCTKPPKSWIGKKKVPRFFDKDGLRSPNPQWRPFVVTVSKTAHKNGIELDKKNYQLSNSAVKDIFAILGSFFNFLIAEEYTELNPILQIRQKSRFIRKTQTTLRIRRLSPIQWEYLLKTAEILADKHPELHERTLFILSALYSMYLRISELVANKRWTPKMGDFYRDSEGSWWFITVGKGNKERQIAVSDAMLNALKRWRKYLNLSPAPAPGESTPLLPKAIGSGPITSTTYIREIIQQCFDITATKLKGEGLDEEAEALSTATVHWLRHTGISEDVKIRPREHVRDDAGHSTSAITDKYIDIELKERHASAKRKTLKTQEQHEE